VNIQRDYIYYFRDYKEKEEITGFINNEWYMYTEDVTATRISGSNGTVLVKI